MPAETTKKAELSDTSDGSPATWTTARGRTVISAEADALAKSGISKDEAVIEVLDYGKRSLFGGTKRPAVVSVRRR